MLKIDLLARLFTGKKAVKFDEMIEALGSSEISIRKYLKQLGAQSCVNKNSRFYILPHQHEFDNQGLLRLRDVVFHRDNTLKKAIVSLVESSASGMKTKDLDALLLTKTHSHMAALYRSGALSRQGKGAGGAYVFYSGDEALATVQQQHREELQRQFEKEQKAAQKTPEVIAAARKDLAPPDVVEVMHTLLQHPDFNAKSVALSLQRRGRKMSLSLVEQIFEAYELGGKKS